MFRLKTPVVLMLAFAFLLLTACGGDFSSLDEDLRVSDMSSDEVATYCEDEEDFFDNNVTDDEALEASCATLSILMTAFAGAFAGDDEEADLVTVCDNFYTECLEEEGESTNGDGGSCLDRYDKAECTATVGEFADCRREVVEGLKDVNREFTCEIFADEDAMEDDDHPLGIALDKFLEGGPACTIVNDKCPVAEDEEGED